MPQPQVVVGDVTARLALDALRRINEEAAKMDASVKRTREDWRDYGEQLRIKRREVGNNIQFGRWVAANGLDAAPANSNVVRSDAIWLAENWSNVQEFFRVMGARNTGINRPDELRKACRKARMPWASAPVVARNAAPRVTTAQAAPRTAGWADAVPHHLGSYPRGFRRNALTRAGEIRSAVEAELGREIPRNLHVALDSDEAREIAAAVQRVADQHNPAEAVERANAAHTEVMTEVATLPESAQARFTRLVERETAALRARFDVDVAAAVAQRVIPARESYERASAVANEQQADFARRSRSLDQWMTKEEFKIILGCLHPDRQPESERAKYDRAFQIFKRLEVLARGWT